MLMQLPPTACRHGILAAKTNTLTDSPAHLISERRIYMSGMGIEKQARHRAPNLRAWAALRGKLSYLPSFHVDGGRGDSRNTP